MTKPLLIVVDDERDMAEFVSDVGEDVGFEVQIATTAKEFQNLFKANRPAGIVLDIVMPDIDGNELLQWLCEQGSLVPVVIMSGYDGQYLAITERLGQVRGAIIVGALVKPIRVDDLEPILQKIAASIRE